MKKGPVEHEHVDGHVPTHAEIQDELKKLKWGRTFVTQFLDNAQKNVRITYIRSRGYCEMLDSLGDLMQRVSATLRVSPSDVSSLVVVSLYGRTVGSFLAAVRLVTSGQLAEFYAQLRVCIESALYAFHVRTAPSLAGVWFNRHDDAEARKKCQNSFKVGEIWKLLKSQDAALEKRASEAYQRCIDFGAHPNERSVTVNLEANPEDGVTFHHLNTRPVLFDLSLLTVVHITLCVVEIFEKVFPEKFTQVNSRECRRSIQEQHDRIAPGVIAKFKALRTHDPKR